MQGIPGRTDGVELRLEEIERRARAANGDAPLRLREWLALAEAWRIAQALRETRGNRSAAARALGIGRRTLYTKIDKLGLVPAWRVAGAAPGDAATAAGASATRLD
jgi:DNA-binding NtrC family response regulator